MRLDLCAGIGGWGAEALGIDTNSDVALTRDAAGLRTLVADVGLVPTPMILTQFPDVEGLLASPPCPPFSATGTGEGRRDIGMVIGAIADLGYGTDTRTLAGEHCSDARSILSVEPLRWVLALRPRWTAWEQVPGALPIWQAAARVLAEHGYSVWAGKMEANDYGVAQNRTRAILMASRDRIACKPAPTIVGRVIADVLTAPPGCELHMGRSRGTVRGPERPAPTIMFGKSPNDVGWYRDGEFIESLSLADALALQSFPADYPVRGGKVSQYAQVGNAIPPALASAIIDTLTS